MSEKINQELRQSHRKLTLEDGTIVSMTGRENGDYSTTEETVSAICSEILGLDTIDVSENLIAIGADSLSLLEIVQEISDKYHIDIETDEISSKISVIKIAELINIKLDK